MPDIYVQDGWIADSLWIWLVGVAITYGAAWLLGRGKKR